MSPVARHLPVHLAADCRLVGTVAEMEQAMSAKRYPAWWPKNPYPEDIFTGTRDDYVKAIPDERLRTKCSGFLGREFWQIASDDIFDAMQEHAEDTHDAALAALAMAEKALEAVEWGQVDMVSFEEIKCPYCEAFEPGPHRPNCALAAVLAECKKARGA